METGPPSDAISRTRPRLYGIVHTYIQKHLPRDVHPAFRALRDPEEAAVAVSQVGPAEETYSRLLTARERVPAVDPTDGNENDDDLPL